MDFLGEKVLVIGDGLSARDIVRELRDKGTAAQITQSIHRPGTNVVQRFFGMCLSDDIQMIL